MTIKKENAITNSAARARRLRELASKRPTRAQVEAALAMLGPLKENLYERLAGKIDVDRLMRTRKE